MGFSPSDMEFHKTKDAAAREIALAFGVPPMLLGIPGDATYANYQEANRAFYRLTVLPLASAGDGGGGHVVGATYVGEELCTLKPDLDQVPALAHRTRRAMGAGGGGERSCRMRRSARLLGLPAERG